MGLLNLDGGRCQGTAPLRREGLTLAVLQAFGLHTVQLCCHSWKKMVASYILHPTPLAIMLSAHSAENSKLLPDFNKIEVFQSAMRRLELYVACSFFRQRENQNQNTESVDGCNRCSIVY